VALLEGSQASPPLVLLKKSKVKVKTAWLEAVDWDRDSGILNFWN
jgi:hypothetical protein